MTNATHDRVVALRQRQQCNVGKAHEPHRHCHGSAPEFPSEVVLTADEADAVDWLLLVRREGLDVANAFYPPSVGTPAARS